MVPSVPWPKHPPICRSVSKLDIPYLPIPLIEFILLRLVPISLIESNVINPDDKALPTLENALVAEDIYWFTVFTAPFIEQKFFLISILPILLNSFPTLEISLANVAKLFTVCFPSATIVFIWEQLSFIISDIAFILSTFCFIISNVLAIPSCCSTTLEYKELDCILSILSTTSSALLTVDATLLVIFVTLSILPRILSSLKDFNEEEFFLNDLVEFPVLDIISWALVSVTDPK